MLFGNFSWNYKEQFFLRKSKVKESKEKLRTGERGAFLSSKTLRLVDGFWLLAPSSWLKAKGVRLIWTMSTAASMRLFALGTWEWHLWEKIIPAIAY